MVNKRLEYRGPGQLRFPPGYCLPPGTGSIASAAGPSSAAHASPTYPTPFNPQSRTLPSTEHSPQPPPGYYEHGYHHAYMSPSRYAPRLPRTDYMAPQYYGPSGVSGNVYMTPRPAPTPFTAPSPFSFSVNPAQITSRGIMSSPGPIDPHLTGGSALQRPPDPAPPVEDAVEPSAAVKRPRDLSQSPQTVPLKRPKIEAQEGRTPLPPAPTDSTPARSRSRSMSTTSQRQQQAKTTYVEPTSESQSSQSTGAGEEEEEQSQ